MKKLSTLGLIATLTGLAIASLQGSPAAGAADGPQTAYGAPEALGAGSVRSYVTSDTAGKPLAVGVELSSNALNGLPGGEMPSAYFPALPSPGNTTPYKFVMMDWNPVGHIPPGVYDVPHFDFHFYLADRSSLDQIGFGDCPGKGEGVDCATFDRGMTPVPAELAPPGYIAVGAVVPMMGNHLLNVAGPEFQGVPFTHTWIVGSYDGAVTFGEPMITRSYLLSKPSTCVAIAQPAGYEFDGWYPTQYCMRYVAANDTITVSLEGFAARQDRSPLIASSYRSQLCRDADADGLRSWGGSPLSLFQVRAKISASTEGSRVGAVRSLYQTLLGRDPIPADCGGLRNWAGSSLTIDQIRAGIIDSPEYKNKQGR